MIPSFAATNNVPLGTTLTFANTTTDAGLPVSFEHVSGPVVVISNTATVIGVGPVVIRASAAGNTNYFAAVPLTNRFTSVKADQSIPPFAPPDDVPFGTVLNLSSTTTSAGLPVRFAVVSGPAWANKKATSITVTGVGSVVLRATQRGNTNYNAAIPLTNTFTAIKADQTISFSPKASVNFKRNALVALGARSSSRLPVSYTSGDTNVLTISRGAGVMKIRGTVQVTARQAGNANYNAAPEVVRTIEIR